MNIYFSCSLTGGRQDQAVYARIVNHLLKLGHVVPTAHLAHPDIMAQDRIVIASEIYQRDIAWLDGCDAVIAEVSTPSHGVGYEIAYALGLHKPVLCLHHHSRLVSKMLSGNNSEGIQVSAYNDANEAMIRITSFLENLNQRA